MRQRSIAGRLMVSVLLIQLVSALGVVGATLAYERHTRFRAFDVMLRGRADSLLGAVQETSDETDDVMLDRGSVSVPKEDVYQVRDGSGRVLGSSDNWPQVAGGLREQTSDGIFRARLGEQHYRLLRTHGVRVVDPGRSNGGTAHPVTIVYGSPTTSVWREIEAAVAFYAVASCLLLIFTGALVFWQLRRALLPLRELAAEAEGISAERWDFNPAESARSTKELAPLATALESAVKRLEQSFEQQRHFVSDAAHELKTAVAVIKSSLQLLGMRRRSEEEYEVGLDRSLVDCERMEEIVAKMLTLARLESRPGGGVQERRADLTACAMGAMEQLQAFAELRQTRVSVASTEPVFAPLTAEEGSLLCSNLLLNALQHSGPGSEVRLSTVVNGAEWGELRVQDQGEGIDPAIVPYVFERFYRGDPSRARKTGGTGLGLAICRAIARNAGGTIHLESTEGVGTLAVVRLPRAADRGKDGATLPAEVSVSSA